MAAKSGISWTNATWGPVTGCTKLSAGCKFCYAERDWARLAHLPAYAGRNFTDVAFHPERLDQPLRWQRPRMIFVNSMSDLFHEKIRLDVVDQIFAIMGLCDVLRKHTFQVLTKRPERMRAYLSDPDTVCRVTRHMKTLVPKDYIGRNFPVLWPLPNVWIGVSVEDQATAGERIPALLAAPASVRWISAEPLLGPVDLRRFNFNYLDRLPKGVTSLDWVVCGGESGNLARPMHPEWAIDLRDQCISAGVPFFFKQTGAWQMIAPGEASKRKYAGKATRFQHGATFVKTRGGGSEELVGEIWQEWPGDGRHT